MKREIIYSFVFCIMLFSKSATAQKKLDYSFQDFFYKGEISNTPLYNISIDNLSYSTSNLLLNFRVLYPVFDNFEAGGKFGYSYFSNTLSGLTNLSLIIKYGFEIDALSFSVGTQLEFSTGSERVYEDRTVNGVFVCFNHKLNERLFLNLAVNRTFGIVSKYLPLTNDPDLFKINDNSDKIGIEFLYKPDDNISLVFEVTSNNYTLIDKHRTLVSLGTNYNTESFGILRAAFGFDIDDKRGKFFTVGVLF